MECATCGFDVPAGNKFCLQCGTPVSAVLAPAPVGDKSARRCPQCGAEAAESQKFCQRCGAVLAAGVAAPSRAEGKPASSVGLVLLIVAGLAVLIAGGYLGYRYLANRAAPGGRAATAES